MKIIDLPSRKIEAWHYTDLSQTDLGLYPIAEPPTGVAAEAGVLHFVNGFLVGQPALPAGVTLEALPAGDALLAAADLPMVALNAGSFSDAWLLRVAAGAKIIAPIEILSQAKADSAGLQFHNRVVLKLEEGAAATIFETHRGEGRYFSNSVLEIYLAAKAALQHVTLQDEGTDATHIATLGISLAAEAAYRGVVLQLGAKLARHEIHAWLDGRSAEFSLDGASLALGRQHLDNSTRVIHRAPACQSKQLFKTVLDEEGHGVFQGTILVERLAQKTNAYQMSRALMLSDRAAMDNKPELEIFADDVRCGHGATIGDIDEDQLFYLRARGVTEDVARQMLIAAFLREVVEQIDDDALRLRLGDLLQQRLGARV